jgi:hypothetical protein
LISQDVFHFAIQVVRVGVDELEIPLMVRLPLQLLEMIAQNLLDESRAGALSADLPINLGPTIS